MKRAKKKKGSKKRAPKKMTITKTRTKTRVTVRNPSPAYARVKKKLDRSRAESSRLRKKLAAKKKRTNPRRPPKRWFDRCLASTTAQRHARDPAAVCGAAWWKMPAAKRAAIVRRWERGSPRQRRVAVAVAKAERNRAEGPPRRKNPTPMTDAEARAEYERTHWGDRGRGAVARKRAANPAHGTATKLGALVKVIYETTKGGERAEWDHDFEGQRPDLLYNEGGLIIAGGQYVIREGGIDG